ncbi:hypothetical protein BP5796_04630 [Coleophoma crateriformis]|uniref:Gastric mucin-like protein n=1 Tax=Coleophoma crateriformis TaxID=565419 RepID=A0A3D8S9V2_9HELO|nr:hypothetical protein BP5796_04630 [Coleophoma crateriformis]
MASHTNEQPLGKLVALEGDKEMISTQLRLLPPSSKVLVIPSILEHLPPSLEESEFDARTFIREVHTVYNKRRDAARMFLQKSTKADPRVVFMNGGSVSAQATCISRICEEITDGEVGKAEAVFNDIVKDGIIGLMRDEEAKEAEIDTEDKPFMDRNGQPIDEEIVLPNGETPSLMVTKAAESLSRETGTMGDTNSEADIEPLVDDDMVSIRQTPCASPQLREDVFTTSMGDSIFRSVITVSARRSIFGHGLIANHKHLSIISNLTMEEEEEVEEEEDYGDDYDSLTPGEESALSGPATPNNVVFGEACLVDVHPATPEKVIRKVTSVDRFTSSKPSLESRRVARQRLKHSLSSNFLDVRPTADSRAMHRSSISSFEMLPRTTFMKASETTIRRSPTWGGSVRSFSPNEPTPRIFVDRASDAYIVEEATKAKKPLCEVVFAVFEDLVIHFTDGSENEILDSVLRTFKDNSDYPLICSSASSTLCDASDRHEVESQSTVETDDAGYIRRYESDSCKSVSPVDDCFPTNRLWPPHHSLEHIRGDRTIQPPTPAMTPPPSTANNMFQRYQEFTAESLNAVDVQNSLRAILKEHLPSSEGYSQHFYTLMPEASRFWKPVFKCDSDNTSETCARTVDQIIALGCEAGVNKDFFAEITGQVEKLGSKTSGISRSGKLDLRYLIATALESFAAYHMSSLDPLSDPEFLAALIIPHLDAYLAINVSTRFLIIQYSAAQLPIVLALRTLLGSSLFRVAGVLDSPPFQLTRPQTPTSSIPLAQFSAKNAKARGNLVSVPAGSVSRHPDRKSSLPPRKLPSLSFSRADYVLPSTATDNEITIFLSSIWKALIEHADFYRPELEPEAEPSTPDPRSKGTTMTGPPTSISKCSLPKTPPHTPLKTSRLSQPLQDLSAHQERPNSTQSRAETTSSRPSRLQSKTSYAPSIRSVRTTASERGHRDDACERQSEKEWADFYIGDVDSDDDAYDRMVLGRAGVVPGKTVYHTKKKQSPMVEVAQRRPANSKKALKWLGLA